MEPTIYFNSLQHLADTCEYSTRSYSGRGMMGGTCLGIDIPEGKEVSDFLADIIEHLVGLNVRNAEEQDMMYESLANIHEALRNMRWDSMGKGRILYFPKVPFVPTPFQLKASSSPNEDDDYE